VSGSSPRLAKALPVRRLGYGSCAALAGSATAVRVFGSVGLGSCLQLFAYRAGVFFLSSNFFVSAQGFGHVMWCSAGEKQACLGACISLTFGGAAAAAAGPRGVGAFGQGAGSGNPAGCSPWPPRGRHAARGGGGTKARLLRRGRRRGCCGGEAAARGPNVGEQSTAEGISGRKDTTASYTSPRPGERSIGPRRKEDGWWLGGRVARYRLAKSKGGSFEDTDVTSARGGGRRVGTVRGLTPLFKRHAKPIRDVAKALAREQAYKAETTRREQVRTRG